MLHLNIIFVKTNQTSSPVTILQTVESKSNVGLHVLDYSEIMQLASQYSYVNCIKLIRHHDRGKNRRSQMNHGKRRQVQAARTAHTEIPEERQKLLW